MPISLTHTSAPKAMAPSGQGVASARRLSMAAAILPTLRFWSARSRQRNALRDVAQEDHLLNDIGLTRAQALGEAAKPFWRR